MLCSLNWVKTTVAVVFHDHQIFVLLVVHNDRQLCTQFLSVEGFGYEVTLAAGYEHKLVV